MTTKKSTTPAKPSAGNKTRNRDDQPRAEKERTGGRSKIDPEADADDQDADQDADDGDQDEDGRDARSDASPGRNAGSGKATSGSSSLIMQLVGSVVGDNLQDAIASVKTKVAEQMEVHGAEYLDTARTHLIEATEKVVAWGKRHPVQAVAAATALVGVSAFLYATLRNKGEAETAKKGGANS